MHVHVIGAGLLGLSTAFFLRQHGCDVTVIDRQPGPGRETSYANGGMLHASQANPWNAPGVLWQALATLGHEDAALLVRPRALLRVLPWALGFVRHSAPARYRANFERNARLARYSLATMPALRAVLGEDYAFAQRGTLKLFRTSGEVAAAAEICALLERWNVEFRTVDAAGAAAIEPALAPITHELAGGLYFPRDETGDAHRFCVLLAERCRADGVGFRYGAEVDGLRRAADRVCELRIAGRPESVDRLVIAAGSYSCALARGAGLRLPVAPVKGYSLTVPIAGWAAPPQVPVIDDHLHAAVCPLGDRLRVAGTAEIAGYDLDPTPGRIENLFSLVTRLYPAFAPHLDRAYAESWAGLRPMSSDGVGIMGRTPVANLFLNTGHGPLGWTMAAGAGKAVADQIAQAPGAFDLGPYLLSRFRPG